MSNIIYVTAGEKLKKQGAHLVICKPEGSVLVHLEDVIVIILEAQHCSVTVDAHLLCSQAHVPIIICNHQHQPEVFCYSQYSYHRLTSKLQEQLTWSTNACRIQIVAKIIEYKIKHQYQLLQYFDKLADKLSYYESYCATLQQVEDGQSIDTAESLCARMYFKQLFGTQFKRQADDTLNAGLNYGYMLLRAIIMNQIVAKGLHPSLGIWHENQFNNYNLADDIIEIFRPMVDYLVFEVLMEADEFAKEHRVLLQQVLLQRFTYQNKNLDFKQTVSEYLDAVITVFATNEVDQFSIPHLEVADYVYEK